MNTFIPAPTHAPTPTLAPATPNSGLPQRGTPAPMRSLLAKAMANCDEWVVEFQYRDRNGQETRRVVSPIRFAGADRFLGLCLSREEPRQFRLAHCSQLRIRLASDFVMPVPLVG